MAKTRVIYKDIAPWAAEDATVTASGGTGSINKIPFGVDAEKIITLERSRWLLDGSFDSYYGDDKVAFWSMALSDEAGALPSPPKITMTFTEQYSTTGISLTFDEATGEYCSLVNIEWWQGTTLKTSKDFEPDTVTYFCEQRVESFDKIVVSQKKTVVPYRRAKLNSILIGAVREFGMNEIRSATIINQMNEVSVELPVSTFNWTLDSIKKSDYLFQLKQPIQVFNDGALLGVFYVNNSSRRSAHMYQIECHDALGVLDYVPFSGSAYLDGVSATTLITELAKPFEVEVATGVADKTLRGIIPAGTRRSAIQQVLFAWGVCLATDGGGKLRIFNQPTDVVTIAKSRTFTGAAVSTQAIVTSVKVVAHEYAEAENGTVVIGSKKYSDAKTVYQKVNPDVTASDRENVKEVTDATLVSNEIGQEVADRLYAYYTLRDTSSADIVYGGEKLGDRISTYTPWDTLVTGNLHKMEIKLSNTVVYRAEVTGSWQGE